MNSLKKIVMAITIVLSFSACEAQIKNPKTDTVKIYGNCEMCKKAIEKAGNLKRIAKIDWNVDNKVATITYNTMKTSQEEILKRIALSGYDSDKFLAPNEAYSKLPDCCQYMREAKVVAKTLAKTEGSNMESNDPSSKDTQQEPNQLKAVFDNYFAIKEALVKTDGNTASAKAKDMITAINAVKMDKLEMTVHMVWMKVISNLKEDAEHIADTKDVKHQRDHFNTLSKNSYDLMKVVKQETPTYYQFCPMANEGKGANWLSKEDKVRNPYYGSQMLTCGKTVETIK
jgi:copper chaperone CopZ